MAEIATWLAQARLLLRPVTARGPGVQCIAAAGLPGVLPPCSTQPRRTAGQGQIRLRADGRLEVRVFAEGRRRTRALPKGSSRQMAERVREQLVRESREGRLAGTSSETLAVYLRRWLSTTAQRTLRPRSLERYTGVIERHVIPTAGGVRLSAWIAADGSGRLVETRGEPIWFGPADKAAWVAAGSPDLRGDPISDTRFGPTPPGAEPGAPQPWPGSLHYEDLDALPTDVGALRAVIDSRAAAGGGANDYPRFTVVADLLRETVGTPDLRAALFRVAASLGGVELIGQATDRAGRTGTAVAMTGNPSGTGLERHTLIFDPETSMLLAEETVLLEGVDWLDADPPIVIGYNTYLVSDITAAIP